MVARLERPRFCYVQIPAKDVRVSATFYEKLFGWNIRNRESGRPSFDDACGVISGAWVTGREPAREGGLLPYIWVDDLRASVKKIGECGGAAVEAPHPIIRAEQVGLPPFGILQEICSACIKRSSRIIPA
jgi:predicted enzyme related to lactoylglutathione lyase